MAAKVRQIKGAWWVVVHKDGTRRKTRIGPTKDDRRKAEEIATRINGKVAEGTFGLQGATAPTAQPLTCCAILEEHLALRILRDRTRAGYEALGKNHLIPFFADRDLRKITPEDVERLVIHLRDKGRSASTIRNAVKLFQSALERQVQRGQIPRNPAAGCGKMVEQVRKTEGGQARRVQSWTAEEIERLLGLAWAREPELAPILDMLFGTGCRLGEALGLQVEDLRLGEDPPEITIQRSASWGYVTPTKTGKARDVVIPVTLAERLLEQVARRHRMAMAKGWGANVPAWVFPSETGGPLHTSGVREMWKRLRRRCDRAGIRPLRLHDARHSYATLALESGQSVRWVADQLGHADVAMTLNTYSHAMPRAARDLGFAAFGDPRRPDTTPKRKFPNESGAALSPALRGCPSRCSGSWLDPSAPCRSQTGRSGRS